MIKVYIYYVIKYDSIFIFLNNYILTKKICLRLFFKIFLHPIWVFLKNHIKTYRNIIFYYISIYLTFYKLIIQ